MIVPAQVVSAAVPGPYAGDSSAISFEGLWNVGGGRAVTITSGSRFRTQFFGSWVELDFDTSTSSSPNFPVVCTWVDGQYIRTQLDASGKLNVFAQDEGVHTLTVMANIYTGFGQGPADNWNTQVHALKLTGIKVNDGFLIPLQSQAPPIMVCGDSIAAGTRALYNGVGVDGVAGACPEFAFPRFLSNALGYQVAVQAHGGQGFALGGTDGAPGAEAGFGFVYAGASWNPLVAPRAVICYLGTNGGAVAADIQNMTATIRAKFGRCMIIFIAPNNQPGVATAISQALPTLDANVRGHDYSNLGLVGDENADPPGPHPSVLGHIKIANKMIVDVRADLS